MTVQWRYGYGWFRSSCGHSLVLIFLARSSKHRSTPQRFSWPCFFLTLNFGQPLISFTFYSSAAAVWWDDFILSKYYCCIIVRIIVTCDMTHMNMIMYVWYVWLTAWLCLWLYHIESDRKTCLIMNHHRSLLSLETNVTSTFSRMSPRLEMKVMSLRTSPACWKSCETRLASWSQCTAWLPLHMGSPRAGNDAFSLACDVLGLGLCLFKLRQLRQWDWHSTSSASLRSPSVPFSKGRKAPIAKMK